jgi:hypothetical protein
MLDPFWLTLEAIAGCEVPLLLMLLAPLLLLALLLFILKVYQASHIVTSRG